MFDWALRIAMVRKTLKVRQQHAEEGILIPISSILGIAVIAVIAVMAVNSIGVRAVIAVIARMSVSSL